LSQATSSPDVTASRLQQALQDIMRAYGDVAVAVSGGVDSMTLGAIAGRGMGHRSRMYHAVSPAVPAEATARVRAVAARERWQLTIVDAGEFADPSYVANPVNRCFFCKVNLYGAIAEVSSAQIVSGANVDDLGEYRPGLDAARRHNVKHPFVEAGIGKGQIRAIARNLGLHDVAELPASPCLSSRVETGIGIRADVLEGIHAVEKAVSARIAARTVRCRVRASGLVVELDAQSLEALGDELKQELRSEVTRLFERVAAPTMVSFAVYRNGSAFLRGSRELT